MCSSMKQPNPDRLVEIDGIPMTVHSADNDRSRKVRLTFSCHTYEYIHLVNMHGSYQVCSPKARSKKERRRGGSLLQTPRNPWEVKERWTRGTLDGKWSKRTEMLFNISTKKMDDMMAPPPEAKNPNDIPWHGQQSCWKGRCGGHSWGWGRCCPPACCGCRSEAGTVSGSQRWHASLWWNRLCPGSLICLAAAHWTKQTCFRL